jgi:hypothetical protein
MVHGSCTEYCHRPLQYMVVKMHICPMEMQIKSVSSCLCSGSELHFMDLPIIYVAILIESLLHISYYFSAYG